MRRCRSVCQRNDPDTLDTECRTRFDLNANEIRFISFQFSFRKKGINANKKQRPFSVENDLLDGVELELLFWLRRRSMSTGDDFIDAELHEVEKKDARQTNEKRIMKQNAKEKIRNGWQATRIGRFYFESGSSRNGRTGRRRAH